ncbi:MAG: class I SAM-dependent methyltransferase [Pirellulales bacterium]|nr:class I SAM-dependent methyltransferase [Pirellulales bacterium]
MHRPIADVVYPERRFGGYSLRDGTVEFYGRVQALLGETDRVLDVGCGRGKYHEDQCRYRRSLCTLQGPGRTVLGIDVDEAGVTNPLIDEFRLITDLDAWPVEDASIDLAVANSVVEHVERPEKFFAEMRRVLKPGGYLCVRTYNVWNYVGVAARLIPNRMHARVTAKAQDDRKEEDVFPTVYRCNTRRKLQRAMQAAGFDAYVYTYEAEPNYLSFSRVLYRIGAAVHAVMPPPFRWSLLGFGRAQ